MKKIVFAVLIITNIMQAQSAEDYLYIASWNVENLFDNIDDPDKADEEWLESSPKNWNDTKIRNKIRNLAKVIRYMNDLEGPDILGIQEIEHQSLLETLITEHFCDKNYMTAYDESPDNRGIDCGLMYNADKLEFVSSSSIEVILPDLYPTRNILYVKLKLLSNSRMMHVFVNHWPSRREGEEKSRPKRIAAAKKLKNFTDKIRNEEKSAFIFITGDFNDEPDNFSIYNTLGAKEYSCGQVDRSSDNLFYNLSSERFSAGRGTYMYRGDWNMLDQIIVSEAVIQKNKFNYICDSFEIIKPNLIVTASGPFKGAAIPTFGGRKYLGGFSDHFPVGAKFLIRKD